MRRPIKETSMKTVSASPVEASASAATPRRVLVWDAPVRVFHWLMVLSFAGAYLTAESERWRLVHVTLGYTMAGLVAFRVIWGLVGTRHARFASFVRGPAAIAAYLRSLLRGHPEPHAGHNPAGALAIIALLSLAGVVTAAGWAGYNEIGGEWVKEFHEVVANVMLALVGVHVAGVLVASRMHRGNLIGAMFSGRKLAHPEDAVRSAWRGVAALMLAAVLGFWVVQWQSAPAADTTMSTRDSHTDDD
jgi:cytochrome b